MKSHERGDRNARTRRAPSDRPSQIDAAIFFLIARGNGGNDNLLAATGREGGAVGLQNFYGTGADSAEPGDSDFQSLSHDAEANRFSAAAIALPGLLMKVLILRTA